MDAANRPATASSHDSSSRASTPQHVRLGHRCAIVVNSDSFDCAKLGASRSMPSLKAGSGSAMGNGEGSGYGQPSAVTAKRNSVPFTIAYSKASEHAKHACAMTTAWALDTSLPLPWEEQLESRLEDGDSVIEVLATALGSPITGGLSLTSGKRPQPLETSFRTSCSSPCLGRQKHTDVRASTAPSVLGASLSSTTPGSRPTSRSERFSPEEKLCFHRTPMPSAKFEDKADVYWHTTGSLRSCLGKQNWHQLPVQKGRFWQHRILKGHLSGTARSRRNALQSKVEERVGAMKGEADTTSVLEQIYPRSPGGGGCSDSDVQLHHSSPAVGLHHWGDVRKGLALRKLSRLPLSPTAQDALRLTAVGSRTSMSGHCAHPESTGLTVPTHMAIGTAAAVLTSSSSHLSLRPPDGLDSTGLMTSGDGHAHRSGNLLLDFRNRIIDKYTSLVDAFDAFVAELRSEALMKGAHIEADDAIMKTFSKKEWRRLLAVKDDSHLHAHRWHGVESTKEERDEIFDLLDSNGNGQVCLREFHIGMEAAAPVRTMEDLRRRWLASGFTTMSQAIAAMETGANQVTATKRLTLKEFGDALGQVKVTDPIEVQSLFCAIALDPNDPQARVSVGELACAIATVSPALLLEDVRDRLLAKWKGIDKAFWELDSDHSGRVEYEEFMDRAVRRLAFSAGDASKVFRQIDIDNSGSISRCEFESALALSEAKLFLEDLRKKIRQRFRSIHAAAMKFFDDEENEKLDEAKRGQTMMACAIAKFKPLIWKVLRQQNPSKFESVDALDALLAKHKGQEEILYRRICRKYGVQPASDSDSDCGESSEVVEVVCASPHGGADDAEDAAAMAASRTADVAVVAAAGAPPPPPLMRSSTMRAPTAAERAQLRKDTFDEQARTLRLKLDKFQELFKNGDVDLRDQETRTLFELVDSNGDGELTVDEFVRGVRLFAPSVYLEDLRMLCLQTGMSTSEVFRRGMPEKVRLNEPLDHKTFQKILTEMNLAIGVQIQHVFDLLDVKNSGQVTLSELVAALQSSGPGSRNRLPDDECDRRSSHAVRGDMSNFSRSVIDFKQEVRQGLIWPPGGAQPRSSETLGSTLGSKELGDASGKAAVFAANGESAIASKESGNCDPAVGAPPPTRIPRGAAAEPRLKAVPIEDLKAIQVLVNSSGGFVASAPSKKKIREKADEAPGTQQDMQISWGKVWRNLNDAETSWSMNCSREYDMMGKFLGCGGGKGHRSREKTKSEELQPYFEKATWELSHDVPLLHKNKSVYALHHGKKAHLACLGE